jgi:AbrB family looped-hinge helix DNA binding protein
MEKMINTINRTNMICMKNKNCQSDDLVSDMIAPRKEKTKHLFGSVKVGERGQIVIPKEAREIFDIKQGDILLVLGDVERGIALVKADALQEFARQILDKASKPDE